MDLNRRGAGIENGTIMPGVQLRMWRKENSSVLFSDGDPMRQLIKGGNTLTIYK